MQQSAIVIPFEKPKDVEPKCSFCNIPKSKATHMFGGSNNKYICGNCVLKAKGRMDANN